MVKIPPCISSRFTSPVAAYLGLEVDRKGTQFGLALFKLLQDTYPATEPLAHWENA